MATKRKTVYAAVDAGNGGTNAIVRNGKRMHSVYFPSARAVATGDTLGFDREVTYNIVEWGEGKYVVGEEALTVLAGVESHVGRNRYGNEFHSHLVATALARCAVNLVDVDLSLMMPPGLYKRQQSVVDYFTENKDVTISIGDYKLPRSWSYNHVSVVPEGLAAALALVLDKNGKMVDSDIIDGNILVLDGGMFSFDSVLLRNGNFDPDTLQHATNLQAGIKKQVLSPILRGLRATYNDCSMLEVEHVDAVLRRGMESGDWGLQTGVYVGNDAIDTEPMFRKQFQGFADYVANRIIDDVYDGLDGIRGVFLIGGWADMVEPHMLDYYGDKILSVNTVPHLSGVHPIDMNAVGALRHRLFKVAQE